MSNNKQALQVAALKNGTVIDHIPSDKLFTVVNLLGLQNSDSNMTIGNNLESKKLGKKGIIKVADRFFTDEEISRLSVVSPNVKLNIIRDYEVVEKKQVIMMVTSFLGLREAPKPDDTADALAVAICHGHTGASKLAKYYNE